MECVALITAWEFNLVYMSCRAGWTWRFLQEVPVMQTSLSVTLRHGGKLTRPSGPAKPGQGPGTNALAELS